MYTEHCTGIHRKCLSAFILGPGSAIGCGTAGAFPEQNVLFCKADTMYKLYYKTVFLYMYIILCICMYVCEPTFPSVLYVLSRNFACDLASPLGRFVD